MLPSAKVLLLAVALSVALSVALGWLSRRVYIDPTLIAFVVILGTMVAWLFWERRDADTRD
jgi:hypothetical protein